MTCNAYVQLKIWVQQYLRFYAIFTTQHLVYLYGVTTVCNEIYSWMYSFKGKNNALDWLISLRSTGSIWLSLFWWCIGTLLWRLLTVSWKSIILKYKKKYMMYVFNLDSTIIILIFKWFHYPRSCSWFFPPMRWNCFAFYNEVYMRIYIFVYNKKLFDCLSKVNQFLLHKI